MYTYIYQFSALQLLSHVRLFATPWTVAHQASLSITGSWSFHKLMSIKSVMFALGGVLEFQFQHQSLQ